MPTFVTTIKYTDTGAANIAETVKRSEAFIAEAKAMGVTVRECFWTLGPTDGLLLFDAPDEETATAAMLHLAARGAVKTQTCRAYRADEMSGIVAKSGG